MLFSHLSEKLKGPHTDLNFVSTGMKKKPNNYCSTMRGRQDSNCFCFWFEGTPFCRYIRRKWHMLKLIFNPQMFYFLNKCIFGLWYYFMLRPYQKGHPYYLLNLGFGIRVLSPEVEFYRVWYHFVFVYAQGSCCFYWCGCHLTKFVSWWKFWIPGNAGRVPLVIY